MMIRSSLFFQYNNVNSTDYGIININIATGLQSEPFGANRTLLEQKIRGRTQPYFQGVQLDPMTFSTSFAFQNSWEDDRVGQYKLNEIARWLTTPYYCPLIFSDDSDKIYNCMLVSSPEVIHNGLKQGYLNIQWRCDDAYAKSAFMSGYHLDLTVNPVGGTNYILENLGDVDMYPQITIQKVGGAGDVSINNNSYNGNGFTITLADQETVTIDCEYQTIQSDIPNTYRYDSFVGNYLAADYGNNNVLIKGKCLVQFSYRYKFIN